MTLHPKIRTSGELSKEAFIQLNRLQTGKLGMLQTGRPYIDEHLGGLMPSSVVLLAALSGGGKTYEAQRIIKGMLDVEINPQADEYVTLEYMLEMKFLDLILRDTHSILDKKKRDILTETFTEEEKQKVRVYAEALKDGRRFIVEESVNTKEFLEITRTFCKANKDKKAIIVHIDHLLLILADGAEDPLKRIAEYTNILRKEFGNVYFFYLSQMNRNIYEKMEEASSRSVPDTSTIYGSSYFEFLSAFAIIMMNPFKMGIEKYMKVKKERYPNLSEFFTEEDNKGRVSFKTLGNAYYHCAKIRDSDQMFDNLHIESMNLSEEHLKNMAMDLEEKSNKIEDIKTPIFGKQQDTIPEFKPMKTFGKAEFNDTAEDEKPF